MSKVHHIHEQYLLRIVSDLFEPVVEVNERLRVDFNPQRILLCSRSINQHVGDMQEVFSRIDSNAVLKSSFPHRHPDTVEVTDSFVELVEESQCTPVKSMTMRSMVTVTPFSVPPPPEFFYEFRALLEGSL